MAIEGWGANLQTIHNKEGKDDMITQAIKHWLTRLFAWWPWRRSPETSYAQAVSNLNAGVTQESLLRNTVDGPVPQAGITSVAVEQGRDDGIPESSRLTTEEPSEHVISPHPPLAEEHSDPLRISAVETSKDQSLTKASSPLPTPEQKLAFLHYLVQRGIVNEGFSEVQMPAQYKKSKKKF